MATSNVCSSIHITWINTCLWHMPFACVWNTHTHTHIAHFRHSGISHFEKHKTERQNGRRKCLKSVNHEQRPLPVKSSELVRWFARSLVGRRRAASQPKRRPYNTRPRRWSRNYSVDQSKIITLIANDIILSGNGCEGRSRPTLFSACNWAVQWPPPLPPLPPPPSGNDDGHHQPKVHCIWQICIYEMGKRIMGRVCVVVCPLGSFWRTFPLSHIHMHVSGPTPPALRWLPGFYPVAS